MKPQIHLALFLLLVCCSGSHAQYDPLADPRAVVIAGNARFTMLTPGVVRMEWAENGLFEDRASFTFVNRKLPVPAFTRTDEGGKLLIRTEKMTIRYAPGAGPFTAENLEIEFDNRGKKIVWRYGMENRGNLLGTTRTLDGTDGDIADRRDTTKKVRLEEGMLSREGWTLVDDSQKLLFDNSDWPWATPRPAKKLQDLYFFAYGNDYKRALYDFTRVAGKIALPPEFAFGYWYSRYWPYTETEFRELVETFESLNIPLDVLVIDMDWHVTSLPEFFKDGKRLRDQANQQSGWTGYTWDRNYFPFWEEFLKWTGEKHLATCLNLHPASGFQPHEEKYPEMARAMGIDPATKKYVQFDIVDKEWAKNYFDLVLHPLEKKGIDFWWLDWQQWSTTSLPGVNPTFYLNYVHFSDMERQGTKRPFIYHRWGGLGNHRYQIGFSGDTRITWRSLDYQPYFTATAANVGFGYWGHDIGGHYDPEADNDPELFTRWFQFGVFSPILKTHATHDAKIKRKPWEFPPETFFRVRDLIDLRYALHPYIYTEARYAYDTGLSICRPLYYDDPDAEEAYAFRNEYRFGRSMIAAPVTHLMEKGKFAAAEKVWLPEGTWYEWSSGAVLKGGTSYTRSFTLDELPVYVAAGAILPMQAKPERIGARPAGPLVLAIFPGDSGSARVYEDEGNTPAYAKGAYAFTPARFARTGNRIAVTIGPAEGSYPGMPSRRSWELRVVHVFPPLRVWVGGRELSFAAEGKPGWSYDGARLTLRVPVEDLPTGRQVAVEAEFPAEDPLLLDGVPGTCGRLAAFVKFLAGTKTFWWQDNWNDGLTPSGPLIRASQLGEILTLHPENGIGELKKFHREWNGILETIRINAEKKDLYRPYYDLIKN